MAKTLKKLKEIPAEETSLAITTEKEVSLNEIEKIKDSCARIGVSIDDYVRAIKDALQAEKITLDKYGEEHVEADHDKRLKAALIGLELEGYIKNKLVAQDNRKYTQVIYQWKNQS